MARKAIRQESIKIRKNSRRRKKGMKLGARDAALIVRSPGHKQDVKGSTSPANNSIEIPMDAAPVVNGKYLRELDFRET